jgi:sugar phosphate isomerase/epimerase
MLWRHPDHARARVRLGYCLNLHPAEDFEELLAGMRAITLPLRARLARGSGRFGVGLYLSAALARRLASDEGAGDLARLERFLDENALDPFTYNAFPAGGFHAAGLKAAVFRPTWVEEERLRFTFDVAAIAARLAALAPLDGARSHVSISTHTGGLATKMRGAAEIAACRENYARAARELAAIEASSGTRIVLALEPEPRALSADTRELAEFFERLRGTPEVARHLGACLDACHAAVEYEDPEESVARATATNPLGKLQFSSALAIVDPARSDEARERLLAMDEPRYLHQVTGIAHGERCQATDLSELVDHLRGPARETWLACPEWRCHFHVPVDLETVGAEGLATTRGHADRLLERALARPERWGVDELHLEIETYTWDVLPGAARGSGATVDGLEREYAHVMERLRRSGWRRDEDARG